VEYHRIYKVNKTNVKKALILEHGKAKKRFGMDIISNGPFTEVNIHKEYYSIYNRIYTYIKYITNTLYSYNLNLYIFIYINDNLTCIYFKIYSKNIIVTWL